MATTTNYSWTTPDNTAYVKDGASAIRTLGSSVDTTLFSVTSGKNVGLVHLNSTNFSASSGVSLSSVFTSAFQSYRIIISNLSLTLGSQNINFRLRTGATDSITNYYYAGFSAYTPGTSLAFSGAANDAQWPMATANVTHRGGAVMDLQNPQLSVATSLQNWSSYWDGSNINNRSVNGNHIATTSYDGFTIYPSSSTMTGTVSVYGYRSA